MRGSGDVWALRRRDDGRKLAELVVTGGEFPWLSARVEPAEGLEDFLPLFAEGLLRLSHLDDDAESWERAYDAVRAVVTLCYPGGHEVPEFLLHLRGGEAWWRWSDEPFDEDFQGCAVGTVMRAGQGFSVRWPSVSV